MNSRERIIIYIIICFMWTICIGGCGNKHAPQKTDGSITLNFWNGFTGPDGKTMEKIVREFNAKHQNIKVRMQIIPWGTYYDKVTLGLAYGGAPDVFILHASRFPEYSSSGALNRMDDLVKNGELLPADFALRSWSAAQYKGKQYAIPLDCHPLGLYYNTKLFKQAGIVDKQGNAKPPTDLEEFLSAGKKLTRDLDGDGRIDQWGFAYTYLRTNAATFLSQYGAGILDQDMRKSGLSQQNALDAMQLMMDIIEKHKVCPSPEGQDAWIGFQTGRVAMALEGIYMLPSLEKQKDLEFAGAQCPVFGKQPGVWADSHLMAMPKNIDKEHRKAAWEFIKYLSDNSLEWAKGGQVPVRKSIFESNDFQKLSVQYQFSRELPYITYLPQSTALNQITPFFDAAVDAIVGKVKPAKDAFAEASRRINKVMDRQ